MLNEMERQTVEAAADKGETAFALEVIRSLARSGRLEEIPEVVTTFAHHVQINRAPVRNFLAHRVPGILANHYFTTVLAPVRTEAGASYPDFVDLSLRQPDWAQPVIAAVRDGDSSAFAEAVQDILRAIESNRVSHPSA